MTKDAQVKKMTDIIAAFVGYTGIHLPDDVLAKLTELRSKEDSPMAGLIYDTMFRNIELAEELDRPSCQDTGVLQFWVKCGTGFPLINELEALLKTVSEDEAAASPSPSATPSATPAASAAPDPYLERPPPQDQELK